MLTIFIRLWFVLVNTRSVFLGMKCSHAGHHLPQRLTSFFYSEPLERLTSLLPETFGTFWLLLVFVCNPDLYGLFGSTIHLFVPKMRLLCYLFLGRGLRALSYLNAISLRQIPTVVENPGEV